MKGFLTPLRNFRRVPPPRRRRWVSAFDPADRVASQFQPGLQFKFSLHICAVGINSPDAQVKLSSDCMAVLAPPDQLKDFELPVGKVLHGNASAQPPAAAENI